MVRKPARLPDGQVLDLSSLREKAVPASPVGELTTLNSSLEVERSISFLVIRGSSKEGCFERSAFGEESTG